MCQSRNSTLRSLEYVMKKIILYLILAFCLLSTLISSASAGGYFLIEKRSYVSKGRENICEKLVVNFNKFKDETPLVCERKFHPSYKTFSLPQWEKLEPAQHANTLDRLLTKEIRRSWKYGIPTIRKRIAEGTLQLWRSQIDINFDGKPNTVYMMNSHKCNPIKDYERDIAPQMRFMAERNDSVPTNLAFEFFNGSAYGGIFYYKGRSYLHSWIQWPLFNSQRSKNVTGPSPRIAVYETTSPHTYESFAATPICEIGYRK